MGTQGASRPRYEVRWRGPAPEPFESARRVALGWAVGAMMIGPVGALLMQVWGGRSGIEALNGAVVLAGIVVCLHAQLVRRTRVSLGREVARFLIWDGWLAAWGVAAGVISLVTRGRAWTAGGEVILALAQVAVAGALAWSVFRLRGEAVQRAGRDDGICCPTCQYDLRATPERCPECGWERVGARGPLGS